jgi:hypothetical protein
MIPQMCKDQLPPKSSIAKKNSLHVLVLLSCKA